MGKMLIRDEEGNVIGVFNIEGDSPNEVETQGLIEFMGRPEDEDEEDPLPLPTRTVSNIRGGGRTGVLNIVEGLEPPPVNIPDREGPLGLMPIKTRMGVRRGIEEQPGLLQFVTEMTPSAALTAGGATLGGIATGGNPLGIIGGGMLGGFLGELFAQETGITPTSELNLALAGGGPLVGSAVAGGLKLTKLALGTAFTKGFPAARVARARNIMGRAVSEFESIGATILNKTSGVSVRPASSLYKAAARAGVRINPELLKGTRDEIARLVKRLTPISALPDVGQSLKALEQVSKTLLNNPKGVLLEELIEARGFIGAIIGNLNKKGGSRLNVSKRVFAAMNEDLNKIALSPFRKGRQTRLAQSAIKRAKLEFAVERLQDTIARFTTRTFKGLKEGDTLINFKNILKWLDDVTNPKLKAKFDKNFTEVLKEHLPELKESLNALAKLGGVGSPAGPGSIVLRGQTAKIGRSLVGGALGFLGTGGSAIGAAIGGLAGAQGPEMIVGILTTKTGAKFLEAAAKAGEGAISHRAWLTASEIVFRALGEKGGGKGSTLQDTLEIIEPSVIKKGVSARGGGRTGPSSKPKVKAKAKETATGEVTIGPKRTRRRLPADFK